MYNYQRNNRYFAQVADDIKDMAEKELFDLGARDIRPAYRGLYFTASQKILYSINYSSFLINRVLAPIKTFKCHSDKYLYSQSLDINWADFLDQNRTFAVYATVSNSAIKHSKFASLRLKDAIVDYFKKKHNLRPGIDKTNPDVWFNLHIENNHATISVDTSGGSLHRRGYRTKSVEAPMIETLAAALIRYSGWKPNIPLYDPFCGSGTILCEAYLIGTDRPSGILKKRFGFEALPDFNSSLWKDVRTSTLQKNTVIGRGIISGSDIDPVAVQSTRDNCSVIDHENIIDIKRMDVFDILSLENCFIVCNPPYGIRLRKKGNLYGFYKKLGDFLKQRCKGSTAFIYFGEREYIKSMGLKPSWKKILSNGGLDGRLVKYELY
jgi:putative N6-adenine-specific DNA methylase